MGTDCFLPFGFCGLSLKAPKDAPRTPCWANSGGSWTSLGTWENPWNAIVLLGKVMENMGKSWSTLIRGSSQFVEGIATFRPKWDVVWCSCLYIPFHPRYVYNIIHSILHLRCLTTTSCLLSGKQTVCELEHGPFSSLLYPWKKIRFFILISPDIPIKFQLPMVKSTCFLRR